MESGSMGRGEEIYRVVEDNMRTVADGRGHSGSALAVSVCRPQIILVTGIAVKNVLNKLTLRER